MNGLKVTRRRVLAALGVGTLVIGLTGTALAAAPTPGAGPFGTGSWCPAHPLGQGAGMPMSGLAIGVHDEVANLLGLTPEELRAKHQAGQSLADIATEQGVSTEQLVETMLSAHQAQLATLVENGTLTQTQADRMLAAMALRISAMIQWTGGPMGHGMMGQRGYGGRGYGPMGPWFDNATPPTGPAQTQ